MDRTKLLHSLIIGWIIFVFVLYHLQYILLAHVFFDAYASRYAPFLIPLLSRLIS